MTGRTAAALPTARTEVAGAAWLDRLVVAGGYLGDRSNSALVDAYDPASDRWDALPDLPRPLNHAALATAGERLYVTGGFGPATGEGAMWSLGRGERTWRSEPPMPAPRAAHAMVSDGARLFVIGGFSSGRRLGRLDIFDPTSRRWSAGPPLRQEREHLAAAYAAGRVYAIGGRLAGLGSNLRSVESWAPGEGAWRPEPDLVDSRGGTAAAALRDQPCVAGGEEPSGTIASVECLDAGSGWRTVAALTSPRHGLAVVALGDALHVVAGGPQPGLTVSAAHEVLLV